MEPELITLTEAELLNFISEAEAKFILEHAEKQLKDILDANNMVVSRTASISTLLIGLFIALSGFCVNRYQQKLIDELFATGTLTTFYIMLLLFYLGFNFNSESYYSVGSEPKAFLNTGTFNEQNQSYRLMAMYVNEIYSYQFRIEKDKRIVAWKWNIFNNAVNKLLQLPLLIIIVFAIMTILMEHLLF